MRLGTRVARDRERRGLTQGQLAEALMSLAKRQRAPRGRGPLGQEPDAMRVWIAKLETGKLRREIGEVARRALADALAPFSDPDIYKSLPLQDLAALQADEPTEFPFEELWVFSRRPLEVRTPSYARALVTRWIDSSGHPEDRPVLYVVPDKHVEERLRASLEAAALAYEHGNDAVQMNLRIWQVQSDRLSFAPHWFIRFSSKRGSEPVYDGWVELSEDGYNTPRRFGRLSNDHVDHVIFELQAAGLLDSDLRYRRDREP